MATPPTSTTTTTTARPARSKGVPTLVQELWDLVVTYARQETVEPLKGLTRFVAYGVAGSLLLGIGVVLLLLAGLRALQEEAAGTFDGNWSWAPYAITLGGTLVVIALAITAVVRGTGRRR